MTDVVSRLVPVDDNLAEGDETITATLIPLIPIALVAKQAVR